MKKTLIWKNIKAEDRGIKIISLPPIKLSTPRVTETEIEGRDGSLTELDGYQADTKSVVVDYRGGNAYKIAQWLNGEGEVIFGNLADRYYKARINNMIPIEQIIENQMYTFPIEFRCQPFGYLLEGKKTLSLTGATTLNNNKATYKSLPTITIYGSGACTVTINNRTFGITDIGTSITIDSFLELVYNDKGDKMTGKFPYLDVGENNISFTGGGVTRIEITPNWRSL